MSDPEGNFWGAAIGGAIGSGFSVGSDYFNNRDIDWGCAFANGFVGAIAGATGGLVSGVIAKDVAATGMKYGVGAATAAKHGKVLGNTVGGAVGAADASVLGQGAEDMLNGEDVSIDTKEVLSDSLIGGVIGSAAGVIGVGELVEKAPVGIGGSIGAALSKKKRKRGFGKDCRRARQKSVKCTDGQTI
ncbi:hypothetical protein [Thalassovita sp.]|uniref:hypothetical protein n=1 Tax=Thalassovita sp. TaxID=1979401 RepID=UPI002B2744DE|nr:hypothetical protein [Thalassovita sp.]